jgi:DNA-binding CsgD family transcriptional regulator
MNNKKAIAHFRQLCSLGLPSESLSIALTEALHNVVPTLYNRMTWCDQNLALTALYSEAPEMYHYGRLFLEELDGHMPDFPGSHYILSCKPGVGHYLPIVTKRQYFAGRYHNEIERPVGGHHFMDMVIGDEHGNLGAILLTREARAKPFNRDEIRVLDQLIPYIAYAMRTTPTRQSESNARPETAVMVCDPQGQLQYSSGMAQQWTIMAFSPETATGDLHRKISADIPESIKALCRAIEHLRAGESAALPTLSIDNPWGHFQFTATALHSQSANQKPMCAITVERREPKTLALMRSMWQLGLSNAQKEVCLALVEAHATEPQIAQRLGVQPSTVRDHLDKIYRKLDVHSRNELVEVLSRPSVRATVV